MIDEYITIPRPVEAEIKVKASRFIGWAHPVNSAETALTVLETAAKQYYDATHHCYAYQTGVGRDMKFRYSDDGEPSGTAGKPIYHVITGKGLTDIIVIVTRYYGGTKLGAGGLVRAYSDCAAETISRTERVTRIITAPVQISFPYAETNTVMRIIHAYQGQVGASEYDQLTTLSVELRLSAIEPFRRDLINLTRGQAVAGNDES